MWRRIAADVSRTHDAEDAMRAIRASYRTACGVKVISSRVRGRYNASPSPRRDVARKLRASVDEARACQSRARASRNRKLESRRRVVADDVIRRATDILATPSSHRWPVLALALLVTSGRRMTEILNGRSKFVRVKGAPRAALFSGQLKAHAAPYAIPLLVPFSTFQTGLVALRDIMPKGMRGVSNLEVERRLGSSVRVALARDAVFASVGRVHGLRSVYASVVYQSLVTSGEVVDEAVEYVTAVVLGHASVDQTMDYKQYRVILRHPLDVGRWSTYRRRIE